MLIKRIATALVLLPIIVWLLFVASLSYFTIGISFVILLAGWEWSRLMGLTQLPSRFIYLIILQLIMIAILWLVPDIEFWPGAPEPQSLAQWLNIRYIPLWIMSIGVIWWLICLGSLILGKPNWLAGSHLLWARGIAGLLILLPCWVSLISIRSIDILQSFLSGSWLLLFALLQIWAADTGAYFAGKALGKHQLASRVSPKKTWEGVFGGTILAFVIAIFTASPFGVDMSLFSIVMISVILVLFSIVGDLTESIYKRQQQIKDSSHLLPGHGGILDRIDSITSAIPVFSFILYWLTNYSG